MVWLYLVKKKEEEEEEEGGLLVFSIVPEISTVFLTFSEGSSSCLNMHIIFTKIPNRFVLSFLYLVH